MLRFHGWVRISNDVVVKPVGQTKMAEIPVVQNEVFGTGDNKKEHASFFTVEVWDTAADYVEKYAKKGDTLIIESGRLRQDRWEKDGVQKSKTVLRVENFKLVSQNPQKVE